MATVLIEPTAMGSFGVGARRPTAAAGSNIIGSVSQRGCARIRHQPDQKSGSCIFVCAVASSSSLRRQAQRLFLRNASASGRGRADVPPAAPSHVLLSPQKNAGVGLHQTQALRMEEQRVHGDVDTADVLRKNELVQAPLTWQHGGMDSNQQGTVDVQNSSPAVVTLYANPICRQMDALLLRAATLDDILSLLVSHRGVLFVHNLVTALTQLSNLGKMTGAERVRSEYDVDFLSNAQVTKTLHDRKINEYSPEIHSRLLRDDRFELLLRDLRDHVPKMHASAILAIQTALRSLDHRPLPLWSRMLGVLGRGSVASPSLSFSSWEQAGKQVAKIELDTAPMVSFPDHTTIADDNPSFPHNDTPTAIALLQNFQWCGYYGSNRFYQNCVALFQRELVTCSMENLTRIAEFYANLDAYEAVIFRLVNSRITQILGEADEDDGKTELPSRFHAHSEFESEISIEQASRLLVACTKHAQPRHVERGCWLLGEKVLLPFLESQPLGRMIVHQGKQDYSLLSQYCKGVRALRQIGICMPRLSSGVLRVAGFACRVENRRRTRSIRPDMACGLLETVGYFGAWTTSEAVQGGSAHNVAAPGKNVDNSRGTSVFDIQSTACKAALDSHIAPLLLYVERHVDLVTEQGAIDATFFLASAGGEKIQRYKYLLRLLFQKIGQGTIWERQKRKVFTLFLAQCLQFPHLDAQLPSRCLNEGLRAWSLHRTDNSELAQELCGLLVQQAKQRQADEAVSKNGKSLPAGGFNPDRSVILPEANSAEEASKNGGDVSMSHGEEIKTLPDLDFFLGAPSEVVLQYYFEDTPYTVDLYFPRLRTGVVFTNEMSRSLSSSIHEKAQTTFPAGGHRLQAVHLRERGYNLLTLPTSDWRNMSAAEKELTAAQLWEKIRNQKFASVTPTSPCN
ncbi:unnamed protein product [Amoebophrya sp. A120]|nr:unnamed protein product [Amoebophrya sp. A120]|eukprot:GSA120T00005315001.1